MLPACALVVWAAGCATPVQDTGGSASNGRALIGRYGCSACHVIPGIDGSIGHVGPPLAGVAVRPKIAGGLENTPENLIRWIREPKKVDRYTEMPEQGITIEEARDIAAYLYTLR